MPTQRVTAPPYGVVECKWTRAHRSKPGGWADEPKFGAPNTLAISPQDR
jgi:hypothetical protein